MRNSYIRTVCSMLVLLFGACLLEAQNVGIGVANPTKGKLEIAGALGNNTTVLTIGSDGAGISLQRNWPTIGFNQYRDANNVQRFIGNGHAGSIFLSSDDGSIVFSQFGKGTANGLISNANYPMHISGTGIVWVTQKLTLSPGAKVTQESSGLNNNLLPYAYGFIGSDGSKFSGTNNFKTTYVALGKYRITFDENIYSMFPCVVISPYGSGLVLASWYFFDVNSKSIEVELFNLSGSHLGANFSFVVFKM